MPISDEKRAARASVEAYFRSTARSELNKTERVDFSSLLNLNDSGKRILFVMAESIGDLYLSTSLFRSISEQYPWAFLYVMTKPEYFPIFKGNPYINGKLLPYIPEAENLFWGEGISSHKGWFEIVFLPTIGTQKIQNYQHNGADVIAFDLKFPEPDKYSKLYLVEPPLPSALAQEIDKGVTDIIHGKV